MHEPTGVAAEVMVPQVRVVQLLPDDAVAGVHEATAVGPVLLGVHVVAT